ncbi:MAG: HAD-IIA family hydrolase [Candidatus Limnocylindrales bacterium]|nr:HAD-IIA family hydrolase [Candidatus Limnocylindrales bacterium]
MHTTDPAALREALRGVRALLLDLDGVIVVAGNAVAGSVDAIAELERRGMPYRIVTNTSLVSRVSLSLHAAKLGNDIPPERFQSALSASAAFAAKTFPGQPLYVIASADARTEFAGQRLLSHVEAAEPGARAAAVIVGDSPDELTHANLNRAFRLVRNGARLIGMHRNPWWLTPDGPTLDSGAYVTGLEFAAGVRAQIIGKPATAFFSIAVDALRHDVAARGGRLRRSEIAIVGDDIRTDVLAGQRAGLRGVFVLTGKHGLDELARLPARGRGGREPHAVAPSLADIVAALDWQDHPT